MKGKSTNTKVVLKVEEKANFSDGLSTFSPLLSLLIVNLDFKIEKYLKEGKEIE